MLLMADLYACETLNLDGCKNVYIDLGSNKGLQVLKHTY